ncbi:MAG: peptide deformylase [Verrucomicrobia bacterium]|nr:peptide deformylase [Verrucomicrobiota bacterium]
MILSIVQFGDPVLRKKGARIEAITPEIKKLIADMFETMHDRHGVGLAAQQVGHAVQLTVIDVSPVAVERPSTLHLDGKAADVKAFMPLVLINPEIKPVADAVEGPEGCLSFPEIFADIERPESIEVTAMNEKGEHIHFRAGGLLARAVQHETDHLHGILFIDRMSTYTKRELKPQLDELQALTKAALKQKGKKEPGNFCGVGSASPFDKGRGVFSLGPLSCHTCSNRSAPSPIPRACASSRCWRRTSFP